MVPSRRCGRATYVAAATWLLVLTSTQMASAEDDYEFVDLDDIHVPELRTPPRLIIGAGGGLGGINGFCDECRLLGAAAFEVYAGWKFHRRVAVLFDSWTTVHFLPADGKNPGFTGTLANTFALQTWITPVVFVRAGLGIGGLWVMSSDVDEYDHGPAISLVVGGELGHRKNSGIDLSLRFSGGPAQYSDPSAPFLYSFAAVITYHRNIQMGVRPSPSDH